MRVEGRKGRKWVRERSEREEKAGRVEGVNNYVVIVIQTLMLDNSGSDSRNLIGQLQVTKRGRGNLSAQGT